MRHNSLNVIGIAGLCALLAGCVGTSSTPTSRDQVPQAVWARVPASTPLDELLQGPDGCFWYLRYGPLETVWVPVRDEESIPVCDPPRERPDDM
ncbi:hypothetical protein [Nioella nitratireducens]|uniref:hypothetical protein n=1 Tax=Nioella nitratireducens TaxID=1287720 RepID=UPI0008FD15EB|nr:hypothetical protein [Nioella nitratireducens]